MSHLSQKDEKNRRQLVKRTYVVMAFFTTSICIICFLSAFLVQRALQGDRQEPVAVAPNVTVQTLVNLPGDKAYPEALTIGPDGSIYSGSFCTGDLWRITPEGELTTWISGELKSVSGMAFAPDGYLYVVEHGDCDPRSSQTSLKRISPAGEVEPYAPYQDDMILNGLTFDGDGRLFATDTQQGDVRLYTQQGEQGRVWWSLPQDGEIPRPTGITYHPQQNAIIVADSNNGKIYQVAIDESGQPGKVDVLFDNADRALDGITLDGEGRLIVTLYDTAQVVRLENPRSMTILAEDFREPSDVAYLDGRIYVTNFDSMSLAPILSVIIDPALPFTIDVIELNETE